MQIAERRVALFHYTLTNDQGQVIDSSSGHAPLAYLHGAGNIVPGLEKALAGRQAGDKFKVAVTPADGYGVQDPALVQTVPREAFHGVPEVEVGMRFQTETAEGPLAVLVTRVDATSVTVDGNHPLAGQTLHFEIEVTQVRDATLEELAHGHVHGPDGHHHH